jgi:hypothetical protein
LSVVREDRPRKAKGEGEVARGVSAERERASAKVRPVFVRTNNTSNAHSPLSLVDGGGTER